MHYSNPELVRLIMNSTTNMVLCISFARSEDTRSRGFKCTGGIMAEEAVALFRNFYEQGNPNGLFFAFAYLFHNS